jgi:hypothetical protein
MGMPFEAAKWKKESPELEIASSSGGAAVMPR